jgi:hypothetical protein
MTGAVSLVVSLPRLTGAIMQGSGKDSSSAAGERVAAGRSKVETRRATDGAVHQDEGSPRFDASAAETDGVAARVRRECAAQGIPERVEDPVTLAKVATLAYEGLAMPSR